MPSNIDNGAACLSRPNRGIGTAKAVIAILHVIVGAATITLAIHGYIVLLISNRPVHSDSESSQLASRMAQSLAYVDFASFFYAIGVALWGMLVLGRYLKPTTPHLSFMAVTTLIVALFRWNLALYAISVLVVAVSLHRMRSRKTRGIERQRPGIGEHASW